MENWISLSHIYNESTPGFGGEQGFFRETKSCIAHGKNSNSEKWVLFNHHGTHIDCPYHFDNDGKKLSDYTDNDWVFQNIFLLEISPGKDEIITLATEKDSIPLSTEFLILKTQFEIYRNDPTYWQNNPGLSPELGIWLREHRPNLKIIGFDFISLTAFQHRTIGKEAHLAFLKPTNEHDGIRIIEDMKLTNLRCAPKTILVSPLFVQNADGAPVNVWAKF